MYKINNASISFVDDLIESLSQDDKAQIEFLIANYKDNFDSPSTIDKAIEVVAKARGINFFVLES